nr:hypothetical protein B0A51_16300 [Rachicladosporium sp. CCFEE 5018]
MAGNAGDLEEILSRLKTTSRTPSTSQPFAQPSFWAPQSATQGAYQPPSVSTPLFSPPIQTPNPIHSSAIISPVGGIAPLPTPGGPAQELNRTNNLLNLLKFNGAAQKPSTPDAIAQGASAAKPSFESTANKANTQDFLLNLLTKPAKAPTVTSPVLPTKADLPSVASIAQSLGNVAITADVPQIETTPARQFGSPAEATKFAAPQPTKSGMFNYVNPFDTLHASSPLNRTPQPAGKIEILKHGRETSDSLNGESGARAAKTRKIESPERQPIQQESVAAPPAKDAQSVSQKLEELSGKVQNQVEEALAAVGDQQARAPSAAATKPAAEQNNDESVDTDWSTAEDEDTKLEEEDKVEVYNFPMEPFVTLQLTTAKAPRQFRSETWEKATPVARLKKDFSHDDRTLAAATQHYIVYSVPPTEKKPDAGLKIIRQDDGKNKAVWNKAGERLCTVQISPYAMGDVECVLATGVNGTIFFTTLSKSGGDTFGDDDPEAYGFTMSPPPNADEPSSTSAFGTSSAIKTRAKLSNRHATSYFAVARGRQIHLIAPDAVKSSYLNQKTHVADTEKYLAEKSLSINTGKAGKDFCFSEDDTVLISLDKIGKVKFWDIRTLTTAIEESKGGNLHHELKEPIHGFSAGASPLHPDDKMSPSSVTLLDKDRPCAKGVALRYLLIGYQQNHILQLWDLGLGKCVQELRFPESAKGSNAMCTINYHPKTGVLCISHPGRNSIYLIHVSAPKYVLPAMTQAHYITALARQDTSLPRVESTAIMSGMREFSLGKIGELRSVDMLKTPFPSEESSGDAAAEILFELYVMHSKGVIALPIKRADLGWDAKSKVIKPVPAQEAGVVEFTKFKDKAAAEVSPSSQPETPSKAPKVAKKEVKAEAPKAIMKKEASPSKSTPSTNGTAAHTPIKQSKQIPEAPAPTNPPIITAEDYAAVAPPVQQREAPKSASPKNPAEATPVAAPAKAPSPPVEKAPALHEASDPSSGLSEALLAKEFSSLYQKLEQDKRVADAAGSAKQDAMLRLVSSTLTENVESSLHNIVGNSIATKVLPALTVSTSAIVERELAKTLNQQVGESVAKEVSAAIPLAVSCALRDAQVTSALSAHIVNEVTKQIKMDMGGLVQRSMQTVQANVTTAITQSTAGTQKALLDLETKLNTQLRDAATQQKAQSDMLVQLTSSMASLTTLVNEVKSQQATLLGSQQSAPAALPSTSDPVEDSPTESLESIEQAELTRLTHLLKSGEYQRATIDWLQSSNQADLFDNLFIYLNPLYLQQVSPLVALSVSAAITASFETNVEKRLEWLGTIVGNIDVQVRGLSDGGGLGVFGDDADFEMKDGDIRDVAPKIMDVLYQRLQGAYMQLAEREVRDEGALKKLFTLTQQIGQVRKALA